MEFTETGFIVQWSHQILMTTVPSGIQMDKIWAILCGFASVGAVNTQLWMQINGTIQGVGEDLRDSKQGWHIDFISWVSTNLFGHLDQYVENRSKAVLKFSEEVYAKLSPMSTVDKGVENRGTLDLDLTFLFWRPLRLDAQALLHCRVPRVPRY